MRKTINYYIKDRRARFMIKLIAAAGYIVIGILWWTLYGITTVLYHLVCDVIETLFAALETLAAARYRLKQLHQRFSYFEMLIMGISFIAMMLLMVSLLWIFAVIIPTGY